VIDLTWVEISKPALINNIHQFRALVGRKTLVCPCVKANAYGHGLVESARCFVEAGADWLSVNSLYEAKELREHGIVAPIYIMGYVPPDDLRDVAGFGNLRIVVYDTNIIDMIGGLNEFFKVHIKVETGNNRQGVLLKDLLAFANHIKKYDNIEIEGLASHFANIEDTTDHSYAKNQLQKFNEAVNLLEDNGFHIPIKHISNSAGTLLMPQARFSMVRIGLASYGMWPSKETYASFMDSGLPTINLIPAFTWKTIVAQIRDIDEGEYIGYGCTYRTSRKTKLAILPIGYYDGYDRGTGAGHVLIHGKRAPIRGRICMNIIMVDITDIEDVRVGDEVVLLGRDGEETISAEMFAGWASTINYEITTRVNDRIPRKIVDKN